MKPIQLSLQSLNAVFTIVVPEATSNAMSEDEFWRTYSPQLQESGDLFEFEHVKGTDPHYVWTIVETGDWDNENWYALPGFHIVNRMGYVTSDVPWENEAMEAVYHDAFDGSESALGEETLGALRSLQASGQEFHIDLFPQMERRLSTAADLEEIAELRKQIEILSNSLEAEAQKRLDAIEDPDKKREFEEKMENISFGLAMKTVGLEHADGVGEKAALHGMITALQTAYMLFGAL